jgi:hypothetical protein
MSKPPNSSWNLFVRTPVPAWMRGPEEPTAYESATKVLEQKDLETWVRQNYRVYYVPEDVLARMGLTERVV